METQQSCWDYLDEFRILEHIDSGTSSQIYKGLDPQDKFVIIKKYHQLKDNVQSIRNQFQVTQLLKHKNIVKVFQIRQSAIFKSSNGRKYKCMAIIMQYIGGGSLFDSISNSGTFSQKLSRTYFSKLLKCLSFIQKQGFVHRDIKPENILLTHNYSLKLIDFEFAKCLNNIQIDTQDSKIPGTSGFVAPQLYQDEESGIKSDIFSAGVTLFIMYVGRLPFQSTNPQALRSYYNFVREQQWDQFWSTFEVELGQNYFSLAFKDLFQKITCTDPQKRLGIDEIYRHQWMRNQICTQQQITREFNQRKLKAQIKRKQIKIPNKGQIASVKSSHCSMQYYIIGIMLSLLLSQVIIFN